jgi:hypothetical protein
VDSVPISSLIVRDVRFGIPEIVREARDVDASVSIPNLPSAGKTRLTISNADRTRSVSLECETHVPTLILPKLPKRFFKARLVSRLATIVLHKGSFRFAWHFPEESASLADWATAAKLCRMMHEQRHARLIISYESKGNVVEVTGTAKGMLSPRGDRDRVQAILDAEQLAKQFDLDLNMVVSQANLFDEASRFIVIKAMLDGSPPDLEIGITLNGEPDAAGKRAGIILPLVARLGQTVLVVVVAVLGPANWTAENRRLSVRGGEARVLAKWTVPAATWNKAEMLARARDLADDSLADIVCYAE